MDNAELKAEADLLVQNCKLPELLAAYPDWFIGGSYSYDLMCWRDLDIYVLDPDRDLKRCFEIGYELTHRLGAWKSRFTNNTERIRNDEPAGFYWGIKLGNERQGAWKLDVWFLDEAGYEEHATYSSDLLDKVTSENRSSILRIKEAFWQRPEFRVSITSDMIYRAVLENEVTTVEEFERFLRERISW